MSLTPTPSEEVRKEAQDEFDWATKTLSLRFQVLCTAVLAALWSILTADRVRVGREVLGFEVQAETLIRATFLFIILALVVEWGQYASAAVVARKRVNFVDAHPDKAKDWDYNRAHLGRWGMFHYHLRWITFWLKQVLAVLGVAAFVLIVFSLEMVPKEGGNGERAPEEVEAADPAPQPGDLR